MQDERINVSAEFSDDEGHLVSHQAADEVNVAAKAVQLCDRDGATLTESPSSPVSVRGRLTFCDGQEGSQ